MWLNILVHCVKLSVYKHLLCYIKGVPKYYLLDKGVPEHTLAR